MSTKQSHRTKLLNAYRGSDIFHDKGRNSPEKPLLDKKIRVNQKPKDFKLFPTQESSKLITVLRKEKPGKTGKRLEKKQTSDIFCIKRKLRHCSIDEDVSSRQTTLNAKGFMEKSSKRNKNDDTNFMQSSYNAMSMTIKSNKNANAHIGIHLKPKSQWKNIRSVEQENKKLQRSSSSREHKIQSFHSNIFFDQEMDKKLMMTDKHNETFNADQSSLGKFTNWIAQLDWKNINTEIHFNNKAQLNQSRSLSAFERRLKENKTTYNNENVDPNIDIRTTYNSSIDCKNCLARTNQIRSVEQVKNAFSLYNRNVAQLAKQYENYSTVQANYTADAYNRENEILTDRKENGKNVKLCAYQETFIDNAIQGPRYQLTECKIIPIPGLRDSDNKYRVNHYTYEQQYHSTKNVMPINSNSYNLLNKKYS